MRFAAFCCVLISVCSWGCFAQGRDVDVYIFVSTDCPVCQKYMNTINELGKKVVCGDQRVNVHAVFSPTTKRREIRTFKKEYSIARETEIIRDKKGTLAKRFRARVTPEAFVVFNDSVQYSGAIDNWFFELGNSRTIVTEHYVMTAVTAICNGIAVENTRIEPVGCLLELYE
jgi:thiol-disulfide isomerase/thioredoxin